MRYIAAYLLAALSGKEPSADDVKKILSSVGIDADESRLNAIMKEVEGKDIDELIAEGEKKLVVSSGAAPVAGGAGAAAGGEAAAEEKEEVKEEEEEMDLGGGMDMFGGGEDY